MFAVLATDYSRGPLALQPDVLAEAEQRFAAGAIDAAELRAITDTFVQLIVAEQERAGLAMLTDGDVRWRDPLAPLVAGLDGLADGGRIAAFERGLDLTLPRVTGAIAHRESLYVDAWELAAAGTGLPLKQVIPGPYSVGLLTGLEGADRRRVTLQLADALNEELRALVLAGCLLIQVQEDGLARVGASAMDEQALFRDAQQRLTRDLDNPELVHLSLGVAGGSAADAGASLVFDPPYSSYVFDLLDGPRNWELVLQAPFDRGVICGVSANRSTDADEPEQLAYAIAFAAAANDRGSTRVGIAPSGSLRGMERHYARRKIERLAQSIGVAAAGPIAEVADALEPRPMESGRFPGLRAMARNYAQARARLGLSEWRSA